MRRVWSLALAALLFACAPAPVTVNSISLSESNAPRFADSDPVDDWGGRPPWRYDVHGLDVSRFQNEIDWSMVARSGIRFAFIKATEGGDLLDPKFNDNWRAAARAGVARGAYHFYYFCTAPEVQALWFIRNVPRTKGALPAVLDLEWNPFSPTCRKRPPGPEVRRQVRIFLNMVEDHFGQRPIIYTTPEFYRQTGIAQLREEFWLRSTAQTLDETYPGQRWSFWQYTGTGRVPGVEGDVDINVFTGNASAWNTWRVRQAQ
ncbi:MAG: GH25 family lysozyme [Pseudomonadota bacterium]